MPAAEYLRAGASLAGRLRHHSNLARTGEGWRYGYDLGNGNSVRDCLYIDDMVGACRLALAGPNGIYNIGAGVGTSLNELIEQVQQITGRMLLVERQSTRASDVGRIVLDTARARKMLGWGPSVGLREGLHRTWSDLQ